MKNILVLIIMCFALCGCKPPDSKETVKAEPKIYRVEFYSGGIKIKEWTTNDSMSFYNNRWCFTDKVTNKEILISGSVVVTEL